MGKGRPPQTATELEQDRILTWHLGRILKKVMVDAGIDNITLASLANNTEAAISRLRNGSLSQRNYIKVIRCLPIDSRKEYLEKVFFGEIPTKLPPDVKHRFEEKAKKQKKNILETEDEN